jgi:hypothetical protein
MSLQKLIDLVAGLDKECKTQISCRRVRNELLQIKKLTDILRKEYLAKAVALKADNAAKPKKEPKTPKEPKEPKVKTPKSKTLKAKVYPEPLSAEVKIEMVVEPILPK